MSQSSPPPMRKSAQRSIEILKTEKEPVQEVEVLVPPRKTPEIQEIVPDFMAHLLNTPRFCHDCGGITNFLGVSLSKKFNKPLCRDCCEKYHKLLNVSTA